MHAKRSYAFKRWCMHVDRIDVMGFRHRFVRVVAVAAVTLLFVGGVGTAVAATPAPSTAASVESAKVDARERADAAADRRADRSEFEAGRLDAAAFDEQGDEDAAAERSGGGSILRMIFGLVVVVATIYGVSRLLKAWGRSRLEATGGLAGVIDVVATTQLTGSRALHLVRVGDEVILVGATDHTITQLGAVDIATANELAAATPVGERGGPGAFDDVLRAAEEAGAGARRPLGARAAATKVVDVLQMMTAR